MAPLSVSWVGPREVLFDQRTQDEINALCHASLWQDREFVTESRVNFEKARILVNRRIETVTTLRVLHVDLGPGRRQKYSPVVTVGPTQLLKHRLTCQVLKACCGKNTQLSEAIAVVQSASATVTARRRKAVASSQGSAKPSPANSSLTIRRPGSSTTA